MSILHRCLSATLVLFAGILSAAESSPVVVLGGEVGLAANASLARFRSPPYDALPWIRADLTDEQASEFDDPKANKGNIIRRPFKNYSGDISGRFIEAMSVNAQGSRDIHPAYRELLTELPKLQRSGGYFFHRGEVDWQLPRTSKGAGTMPALWGNARMLCGLVEASRAFPEDATILGMAKKLGDFYVSVVPRFTDPARKAEYTEGGTYASGYVTCWFPAMEGLVKLHLLTKDVKYLAAAATIAEFYKTFDTLPIDHSHGMLCSQIGLLLLYEVTNEPGYLARVESRWDELVRGGYINPAGGIPEKSQEDKIQKGDEGCAEADWMRLNLQLGKVTGKSRYWAMAERTLHNHFLQNQTASGGFGRRLFVCDQDGTYAFRANPSEWTWCCTFHGQIGFTNLRTYLLSRSSDGITCNFALDFTAKDAVGTIVSELRPTAADREIMRQHIRLEGQPATVIRVRQPTWADTVTAIAPDGHAVPLTMNDGFCATTTPVTSVEISYQGGVYAEDRHCNRLADGPVANQPFVLGYGPSLLVTDDKNATGPRWPTTKDALIADGYKPFSADSRSKECYFVFGRTK